MTSTCNETYVIVLVQCKYSYLYLTFEYLIQLYCTSLSVQLLLLYNSIVPWWTWNLAVICAAQYNVIIQHAYVPLERMKTHTSGFVMQNFHKLQLKTVLSWRKFFAWFIV